MLHTSYIELDIDALQNNLRFIKSLLKPGVKYSMVVKSNAYGHGIEDLLPFIESEGVTHFSVFSVKEAMQVKKIMSPDSEVMIMGWMSDDYIGWAIENDVSFFIFNEDRMNAAIQTAKILEKPARVHLELETGLHRTGLSHKELIAIAPVIKANKQHLIIEGLCTHYAGAESYTNYDRIETQLNTFLYLCNVFGEYGIVPKYKHTACSAALFNFPESIMNMVRIGLSSYGYWPSVETKIRYSLANNIDTDPLQSVLSWKSRIMSVSYVSEGCYINYGDNYLTTKPCKIATVPVGYADGYNRVLSNSAHVLVNGKRAPIVGVMNMNEMIIDITSIDTVAVDDEVVMVGRQENNEITIGMFSEMNNSMNYELLTRFPDSVPRKLVQGNRRKQTNHLPAVTISQ